MSHYILVYADPDGITKSIKTWTHAAGLERLRILRNNAAETDDEGSWTLHELGPAQM